MLSIVSQGNTKYYINLDVRIGNDTSDPNSNTVYTNSRCEYKNKHPNNFEYLVFTCPSPGIVGKVITVQKHSGDEMRGHEVEVYGRLHNIKAIFKQLYRKMNLLQTALTHLYILTINASK